MKPEILLIREGDHFRLMHGHLRLCNALYSYRFVDIEVPGEGIVRITRNQLGYFVVEADKWIPILVNVFASDTAAAMSQGREG